MSPNPLLLTAGFVLCGTIGILGTALYYRAQLARKERETWRQARIFYTRMYAQEQSTKH